jgi:hypothetical protein
MPAAGEVRSESSRAVAKRVEPSKREVPTMTHHHPPVDDEDLGIRSYQLRKAKAVETALGRVRHGLGDSWSAFTSDEAEELGWVLGELWTYVAHAGWENLHFGLLSADELHDIIVLGRLMRSHEKPAVETLEKIEALVRAKG